MHLVTYLHPRLPTDSAEEPEKENAKLKKMYAEAQMKSEVLQEALEKKW